MEWLARCNADAMHKVVSPGTYSCSLCAITYGTFSVRKEWKAFIEQLSIPVRFLHRDEWERQFQRKDKLPAVFLRENDQVSTWIGTDTMRGLDLEGLKDHINHKLVDL